MGGLPDHFEESDVTEGDESFVSSREGEEIEGCPHKLSESVEDLIKNYPGKVISSFVTRKTFQFFKRFNVATIFLCQSSKVPSK